MNTNTPIHCSFRIRFAAIFAIFFGVLTIVSGGIALFGPAQAKAMAGNTVAFVLWFNFLAGFLYVIAGIGLYAWQQWAARLSLIIALGSTLVLLAFAWHVFSGQAYEIRTVWAMLFRCIVWISIAIMTHRSNGFRVRHS